MKISSGPAALSKYFESSNITLTVSASGNIAHGLGVKPTLMFGVLECTSAADGYSTGDIVMIGMDTFSSRSQNRGISARADATNIVYKFSAGTGGLLFALMNLTTGGLINATNANWKFRFRAWA